MRFLTSEEKANMTTLEILKHEVTAYLTDEHNNQIQGFYEWSGYWDTKEKATTPSCISGNGLSQRLEHLPELFDYMSSITPEQIRDMTRAEGKEGMRRWPYAGVGRYPDHFKRHRKMAAATINSEAVRNNYAILRRVRWHVGAYLNKLTRAEVQEHVDEVTAHELNSDFWHDTGSRYSNAMFRLKIAKSWLADTDHEDVINRKLGEVASLWLAYHKIDLAKVNASKYNQAVKELRDAEASLKEIKAEHKQVVTEIDAAIHDLRTQVKELDRDVSGMSLTQIMELEGFISEGE